MREKRFFAVVQFKNIFLLAVLCFISVSLQAQQQAKIEILQSNSLEFDDKISKDAQRLIGNVIFKHKDALMYCDSAYFYSEANNLDAFGNVKITQGDTLTLTGKKLFYKGNDQIATVTQDVMMNDRKMTLNTEQLDYNMKESVAYYTDSAHIRDADNVLTSKTGYYFSKSHDLFFRHDVVLVNPRYTMTCDTLKYNTINKTAFFLGPTFIRSKDNLIYCEDGFYNTEKQTSSFSKNSYLVMKNRYLKGDTTFYNRNKGIGIAKGNVLIKDTAQQVFITGDYGEYHELKDSSFVTGHALMTQIIEGDSLHLHADTLKAVSPEQDSVSVNKTSKQIFYAYHKVKIYKKDLQGLCDSLVYDYRDSTMYMFTQPVLWSGLNQLTSDSMRLQMANQNMDKLLMNGASFIVSQADSNETAITDTSRFNQVKGKNMTGYFTNNQLYKVLVEGNGQTIYYAKNKNQSNFGVNRADCSDLIIYVEKNTVTGINLINKPDATLYPINELRASELKLKGFKWFKEKRPNSLEEILN